MTLFVGLDVSQKMTAICVVEESGRRLWRGQCPTEPEQIERAVRGHAGRDAHVGLETGPMTPWLVHELRGRGLNIVCLDARHARAALKMQMNSASDQMLRRHTPTVERTVTPVRHHQNSRNR
jgi:transposase